MRISDWSSDVCASDLIVERAKHESEHHHQPVAHHLGVAAVGEPAAEATADAGRAQPRGDQPRLEEVPLDEGTEPLADAILVARDDRGVRDRQAERSEEHTSELQSLMRIS